jgi:hypothetical protein
MLVLDKIEGSPLFLAGDRKEGCVFSTPSAAKLSFARMSFVEVQCEKPEVSREEWNGMPKASETCPERLTEDLSGDRVCRSILGCMILVVAGHGELLVQEASSMYSKERAFWEWT